jgi:hypothetical protein
MPPVQNNYLDSEENDDMQQEEYMPNAPRLNTAEAIDSFIDETLEGAFRKAAAKSVSWMADVKAHDLHQILFETLCLHRHASVNKMDSRRRFYLDAIIDITKELEFRGTYLSGFIFNPMPVQEFLKNTSSYGGH